MAGSPELGARGSHHQSWNQGLDIFPFVISQDLGRDDDAQKSAVQQLGFIFLVLFEEPSALAELLVARFKLVESLRVAENVRVPLGVAVRHAAGFQWGNRHPL